MSNYNNNKQNSYNDAYFSYNNSNKSGKISPVDIDEIKIVSKNPSINYTFSPIVRKIVVPHAVQ